MKIALYGVSRAGKDYLLEKLVQAFLLQGIAAVHIKGSATLNQLAQQEYGISLKAASEEQKHILREHFIDFVQQQSQQYDVVFVDGHYAFMNGDDFNIVFTDADKHCYDHFFYLDTLSEMILQFSRQFPKNELDSTIQLDEITKWKQFEIKGLQENCADLGKELVILDEDTEQSIAFMTLWIKEYAQRFDYEKLSQQYVAHFLTQQPECNRVILLDCDNTLSVNDATYDFCATLGIDKSVLKQIFANDRYSSYQFFKINQLYQSYAPEKLALAVEFALKQVAISPFVLDWVQSQNNVFTLALTVGLYEVWQAKCDEWSCIHGVLGNSVFALPNMLVTPLLKKYIAQAFKNKGIYVIAIGDSIIDIPMLACADEGYLVAHQKLNRAVMDYFSGSLKSPIMQLFATQWRYPIVQKECP